MKNVMTANRLLEKQNQDNHLAKEMDEQEID
jgi:hypothetical protein